MIKLVLFPLVMLSMRGYRLRNLILNTVEDFARLVVWDTLLIVILGPWVLLPPEYSLLIFLILPTVGIFWSIMGTRLFGHFALIWNYNKVVS